MRKSFRMLMMGACALMGLALVSCDPEAEVKLPTIAVEATISVPAEGVSGATLPATIENAEGWAIDVQATGCVSSASYAAGTVTYSVAPNTDKEAKSGAIVITVSHEGQETVSASIAVSQEGQSASFDVKDSNDNAVASNYDVAAEGGKVVLYVYTNVAWTASADAAWVSVSPASGSASAGVNIEVAANTTVETRTATVTIAAEGFSPVSCTVSQAAAAPFTADVFAMTVTEYLGSPDSRYPDQTYLVAGAENLSTPCVDGYFVMFEYDVIGDYLADFYTDTDTMKAIIDGNGDQFDSKDVEYLNANEGAWVFSGLDPDTEYAFLIHLIAGDGREFLGYAVGKTAPEEEPGEPVELPEELLGSWTCPSTVDNWGDVITDYTWTITAGSKGAMVSGFDKELDDLLAENGLPTCAAVPMTYDPEAKTLSLESWYEFDYGYFIGVDADFNILDYLVFNVDFEARTITSQAGMLYGAYSGSGWYSLYAQQVVFTKNTAARPASVEVPAKAHILKSAKAALPVKESVKLR